MHARKQTLVSMFVFVIIYVQYLALSFLVESPCFFCTCRIVHQRIFRREELRKRRQMSGGGRNGKRGISLPHFSPALPTLSYTLYGAYYTDLHNWLNDRWSEKRGERNRPSPHLQLAMCFPPVSISLCVVRLGIGSMSCRGKRARRRRRPLHKTGGRRRRREVLFQAGKEA